jgi:hypothetical protein
VVIIVAPRRSPGNKGQGAVDIRVVVLECTAHVTQRLRLWTGVPPETHLGARLPICGAFDHGAGYSSRSGIFIGGPGIQSSKS